MGVGLHIEAVYRASLYILVVMINVTFSKIERFL